MDVVTFAFRLYYFEAAFLCYFFADLLQPLFDGTFLAKTKMAKSLNDAATTLFKTMLKHKASARQHWYVEVNEANTTRTYSSCRVIPASAPKGV